MVKSTKVVYKPTAAIAIIPCANCKTEMTMTAITEDEKRRLYGLITSPVPLLCESCSWPNS